MQKYIFIFCFFISAAVSAQISSTQNGQYMQMPSALLNNASTFTVEFWVKTTDARSNDIYWQRPCLFGNVTDGNNSGDFGININDGYVGMYEGLSNLNTDQQFLSNSSPINDNFWHHIAAVNNGQTINLFIDGTLVGSLVSGRPLNTFNAPLTFGGASLDYNFPGNKNYTNFYAQANFGDARISNTPRYFSNFSPANNYISDVNTLAIYHFGANGNYNNNNTAYGNANINTINNTIINLDPNYPVIFDKDQPINNEYAQQATLFVNDSTVLYGRLLLGKKDWSFNTEMGVHFFENGSRKDQYFKTTEIKGFKMGSNNFVPKYLGQGSSVSVPNTKTMVRQLTAVGSKINMYEYIAQTNTKAANGILQYQATLIHFIEIPNSKDDKIYQFSDNKFVPHFETKVSNMVADNPALAEKIRSKNKDYFYAQITEAGHQEKVWNNIVNEYNQ